MAWIFLAVAGLVARVQSQAYFGEQAYDGTPLQYGVGQCMNDETNFRYWGCFQANGVNLGDRPEFKYQPGDYNPGDPSLSLPDWVNNNDFNNTGAPLNCASACRQSGFKTSAMSQGNCRCGMDVFSGTAVDRETYCQRPCSGDADQSCGGTNGGDNIDVYVDATFASLSAIDGAGTSELAGYYQYMGCYYHTTAFLIGQGLNQNEVTSDIKTCAEKCAGYKMPLMQGIHDTDTGKVKCMCGTAFEKSAYRIHENDANFGQFCYASCSDGSANGCAATTFAQLDGSNYAANNMCCGNSNYYPVYVNRELMGCYSPLMPGYGVVDSSNNIQTYECATISSTKTAGPSHYPTQSSWSATQVTVSNRLAPTKPAAVGPDAARFHLQGCFSTPDLVGFSAVNLVLGQKTLQGCISACSTHNFIAMNGGTTCSCSDTAPNDNPQTFDNCNKACADDATQGCGGTASSGSFVVYAREGSWRGKVSSSISQTLLATPYPTYGCAGPSNTNAVISTTSTQTGVSNSISAATSVTASTSASASTTASISPNASVSTSQSNSASVSISANASVSTSQSNSASVSATVSMFVSASGTNGSVSVSGTSSVSYGSVIFSGWNSSLLPSSASVSQSGSALLSGSISLPFSLTSTPMLSLSLSSSALSVSQPVTVSGLSSSASPSQSGSASPSQSGSASPSGSISRPLNLTSTFPSISVSNAGSISLPSSAVSASQSDSVSGLFSSTSASQSSSASLSGSISLPLSLTSTPLLSFSPSSSALSVSQPVTVSGLFSSASPSQSGSASPSGSISRPLNLTSTFPSTSVSNAGSISLPSSAVSASQSASASGPNSTSLLSWAFTSQTVSLPVSETTSMAVSTHSYSSSTSVSTSLSVPLPSASSSIVLDSSSVSMSSPSNSASASMSQPVFVSSSGPDSAAPPASASVSASGSSLLLDMTVTTISSTTPFTSDFGEPTASGLKAASSSVSSFSVLGSPLPSDGAGVIFAVAAPAVAAPPPAPAQNSSALPTQPMTTFVVGAGKEKRLHRRQSNSRSFVGSDGVNNCSQAAVFVASAGGLSLGGDVISTNEPNATYMLFTGSPIVGNIRTTFTVIDGALSWVNPAFFNNSAIFCQTSDTSIYAVFDGSVPIGCTVVRLTPHASSACVNGTLNDNTSSVFPSANPTLTIPLQASTLSLHQNLYSFPMTVPYGEECVTYTGSWMPGSTTLAEETPALFARG